ncbi:MAG: RtcB family protein [Smithellaceae bacterium]|jgi:tRNA-splicing ligase RtcB|nr:RtcB family protein [Smithellaceae bacterium]MDD3260041.1 RtcB family protein [Smithellaceae bacterium]MDD3849059.1 RtcB family protein [Smithellaceae bacterium]HOG11706.1 RtcB family protein [Smithellaceae bacterium]HOQ71757.1 RtcB family protein [Smithellaceae bacterium]
MSEIKLEKLDDNRWLLPRTGAMRVPGIIYANEKISGLLTRDESAKQVANVAHLPGIVDFSLAMPDIHWGYGFPIGGVAAFDMDDGVVSPGGVGYDINCGCRLLATELTLHDIKDNVKDLTTALYRRIPTGVGSTGYVRLSGKDQKKVLEEGAGWAIKAGFGSGQDLETTEDGGCIGGADPEQVSARALERGKQQLGTLGSGNHFLEIEVVEEIFDEKAAQAFGLRKGQVVVMIHTGSRGLGYQICDDYLALMVKHQHETGITLPDRQLACTYLSSARGQNYLAAMACGANYAWANRQILMHLTREVFEKSLRVAPRELGMRLVYDVCHNIAKIESFPLAGVEKKLCVHRKGATRAYPAGHDAVPARYRSVGQPVLIPGDMGAGSYVLVGQEKAMQETFGSACHGAGRVMSRTQAIKSSRGRSISRELAEQGVLVMAGSKGTLSEEMPEAYKNLNDVVGVVHDAGIAKKAARLKSIACIKG